MIAVLLVCAAPVVASYLAYFVLRPQARTNYSELIVPPRPLPASLPLADLDGARGRAARRCAASGCSSSSPAAPAMRAASAISGCSASCTRRSAPRRIGSTSSGWSTTARAPRRETLAAIAATARRARRFAPTTVLRTDRAALADWLAPAPGQALEDHLYIVDPRGDWMMRVPADADPARLKRDLDKLLRASAGWDRAGR